MEHSSPLRANWQVPAPDHLDSERPDFEVIMAEHDNSVAAGSDGYTDPLTRYFVFNVRYLRSRGSCCENGCRHCPYERQ